MSQGCRRMSALPARLEEAAGFEEEEEEKDGADTCISAADPALGLGHIL